MRYSRRRRNEPRILKDGEYILGKLHRERTKVKVLVLGHAEVEQLLPMDECIGVMEEMFKTLARGDAVLPLRKALWQPDKKGLFATMPAYLGSPQVIGGKFITFFPDNNNSNFESHQGAILLFECVNGRLLAIIDATSVTAIRTGAASGAATKALARKNVHNLAILGSGTQASMHLKSMRSVRELTRVSVWSRNPDHARRFAKNGAKAEGLTIEVAKSAEEAVSGADIVCTTTASTEPILKGKWLTPGVHVNAVGASVAPFRELDSEALVMSSLFTDRRESLLNEANDFLIPRQEGAVTDDHLRGEVGEVLIGKIPGRSNEQEITLFKSLGLAVEDLASAHHIYRKAIEGGMGTWVDFNSEREP